MRLLHVCNQIGGNYFPDLTQGLVAHGIEVTLVSLRPQETPTWLQDFPEVSFFSLNAAARSAYPDAIARVAQEIHKRRVELVHGHLFDAGIVGWAGARLARTPFIHTRHYGDLHFVMKKKVHAAIDSFLERRSDVVITPAGHVRRHLIDHEGVAPEKIIVVHYGIDVDSFRRSEEARRRLRAEFGFTDAFVVGTVASFQPIKGHIYLLEAIAQVARQIPNVRLLLIGTGDRRAVDEAIARLGIQKYVVFAGFRRDVADCLSAMDMMVHPSLTEALCQAVLEGMSAELPVVGADIPFTREVIEPGVNGLIVASCNSSAIAEAILQLHADPPLRNRLAEAARQTAVSGFTIEQMVQGHMDCYRRVMGSDVAGLASMERHDR